MVEAQQTLAYWASIAEILGGISIFTGITIALIQLYHYRGLQRDAIANNLAQTFYNHDLARALTLVQELPDGITLEECRARGRDYTQAVVIVTTSFETMGLLVFKRVAPLELVMDLAGGIIVTTHRKLSRLQDDIRAENKQPSWAEWYHWLGEQVTLAKEKKPPAHKLHREWKG